MSSAVLLEELLDPLSLCIDDQRIADLRLTPSVNARVEYLADHANDGVVTAEERQEYETIVKAADMISILKLKARARLLAKRGA